MELATAVTVTIEFMCSIFIVNLIVIVTQAMNVDIFIAKKNDLSQWISHNLFKKENARKTNWRKFFSIEKWPHFYSSTNCLILQALLFVFLDNRSDRSKSIKFRYHRKMALINLIIRFNYVIFSCWSKMGFYLHFPK